jgi:type I restriction enzyme R subunit
MPLGEADSRAKLVNPALYKTGWTEHQIEREESTGAVDIIVIKVKKDSLPPGHGLHQATGYAKAQRLNVPFVLATNGHMFVQFDRYTGPTTDPRPMAAFPSPVDLRAHYEAAVGFSPNAPADRAAASTLMRAGRR